MLVEVDIDLINRMRKEGRGYEASLLLDAHQKNLKENREQLRKEILSEKKKKDLMVSKRKKECPLCRKDLDEDSLEDGFIRCIDCRKNIRANLRKKNDSRAE